MRCERIDQTSILNFAKFQNGELTPSTKVNILNVSYLNSKITKNLLSQSFINIGEFKIFPHPFFKYQEIDSS
jgi:hypothetical protein